MTGKVLLREISAEYGVVLFSCVTVIVLLFIFVDDHYNVSTQLRDSTWSRIIAGQGWSVLQVAFHIYAGSTDKYVFYKPIGGVLSVLTWLYIARLHPLISASVNVVLSGRVIR
jgi:uncharacterized BrkB/YihY/UPF0761 family membrane protein